jgi:DNA-binding transcriptional regulator YdaS (Cro superfamily)
MSQTTQNQTLGCGGLIALGIFFVMFTSKCSGEAEDAKLPIREQISELRQEISDKKIALMHGKYRCEARTPLESLKEQGEAEQNLWDIAAAENLDNISSAQEWEIRKSIGAELGLAPSEVNGWKEIYRRRAASAKRKLERSDGDKLIEEVKQAHWDKNRQSRCEEYKQADKELAELKADLVELRSKRAMQRKSAQ